MNGPSREEIDAKLETIEARMDGRVASIGAKIDGLAKEMDERFSSIDERYKSLDQRIGRVETAIGETQSSISSLKTTMIVTAISSAIAIVLGVAVFNATLLSNMLASFESGKNTSAVQAELKRQAEETAVLLKQLQARMDASQPSRSGTSPDSK
jgi:uncharacterized protein YdcH (DUF465 family)